MLFAIIGDRHCQEDLLRMSMLAPNYGEGADSDHAVCCSDDLAAQPFMIASKNAQHCEGCVS